ncbi:MAG TPA: hypothetical protein VFZ56_02630 [Gemmatimonadaceae bacterium]
MQQPWTGRTLVAVAAMIFLVAGCNESTAPEFSLAVVNTTDDFAAQSANVFNGNLDQEFTWQNTGTRANVTDATTINGGVARIVIRDAANVVVYDKALTPESPAPVQPVIAGVAGFDGEPASAAIGPTQAGVAGAWRIEILLSGFSGTLNVRVQKL